MALLAKWAGESRSLKIYLFKSVLKITMDKVNYKFIVLFRNLSLLRMIVTLAGEKEERMQRYVLNGST